MILPGEPALWMEYGTDYFVVSFPSKVGYYVIIKKLYVFFVSFVFLRQCLIATSTIDYMAQTF